MGSALFMEVKCIFSTMTEVEIFSKSSWIETEVNGLTSRWIGHVRLVLPTCCERAHRRVRSLAGLARPVRHQRDSEHEGSIRRGGASGHARPDMFGHEWVLTGINQTLALWRPVSSSGTFGRVVKNMNHGDRTPRCVWSILIGASGHCSA
jgi:hypothetical protein